MQNPRARALIPFTDIDTDDGALWDKSQLCDSHREETRDYIRACLGLESRQIREDTVQSVNASIRAFETVGTALRQAYNYGLSTPGPLKFLPVDVSNRQLKFGLYRAT